MYVEGKRKQVSHYASKTVTKERSALLLSLHYVLANCSVESSAWMCFLSIADLPELQL